MGGVVFPPPAVLGQARGGKLGLPGDFNKLRNAARFNRDCYFSKEALQLLIIIRYDIEVIVPITLTRGYSP